MNKSPGFTHIKYKSLGFTFIELMITVAVSGLLFIAAARFAVMSSRSLGVETMKQRVEERVAIAMTRLRGDVRYLAYDPASVGTGSPYITVAQAKTLTFKGDIDGDGTLETVTYRESGGLFERSVDDEEGGQYLPVATNLQTMTFTYYDISGAVTAVANNIRKINLEITFKSEGKDANHDPITFRILTVKETFVPRNLLL